MSAAPSEAGREYDALIAEQVMGWGYRWNVRVRGRARLWRVQAGRADLIMPLFSTDIADAWLVVEKMRERGVFLDIETMGDKYRVVASREGHGDEDIWCVSNPRYAESAPLAICRAALAALTPRPSSQEPTLTLGPLGYCQTKGLLHEFYHERGPNCVEWELRPAAVSPGPTTEAESSATLDDVGEGARTASRPDAAPTTPAPRCPECKHVLDRNGVCWQEGCSRCASRPSPLSRTIPTDPPPFIDDDTFRSMLSAAERVADEVGCNSASLSQQAARTITRLTRHLRRERSGRLAASSGAPETATLDAALGKAVREALPTLPPWAHAMLRAALTPEVSL